MSCLPNHPRVELLNPKVLIPNPRNARTHSDKQISQIAASIRRFGFVVPIIIDDEGNIVAGHGRWPGSKQLELAEVPVIRVRFLSEADRRAFALADNRIAELSGWDENLLAEELSFLLEDGYELEITGFTLSDVNLAIGEAPTDQVEEVELPDPVSAAVSRNGDLWTIGAHRLLCGDSRQVESYEMLLTGERAALVICDPPYNVPIQGHVSGNGRVRHREFAWPVGSCRPPSLPPFYAQCSGCAHASRLMARSTTSSWTGATFARSSTPPMVSTPNSSSCWCGKSETRVRGRFTGASMN